jgi:hypothetical protein
VVGHQLKRIQLDLMDLQAFVKDSLESFVISVFVENSRPKVSAIEGVIQSARFVCAWRSGHG